tara:strand:- start:600 stop:1670 length:1071 start_codon:yes stop_codon:yes gene_type:complete
MVSTEQFKQTILIVLGSGRWGGGEKNCVDLITGLRGHFNFILIHSPGDTINRVLDKENIKHYEFPLHEPPSLNRIFNFIKLVKQLKPRLIHSHLNRANLYLSLAKPWLNSTWIASVHGFTSQLYNIFPDHLICVSHAIQKDLPKVFRKKSTLIYNGIKQMNQSPKISDSRNESVKSYENMQAFVLATIHPNKGQVFICEALRNYDAGITVEFVGMGSQEHTQELLKFIGKSSNVKLDNQIIQDIQSYLDKADFVIIPSYKEALSYVAIESLSAGTPVLASRTGGLPEVVTEGVNGNFFTPGDISSFRLALQQMKIDCNIFKQNLIEQPFLENNEHFTLEFMLDKVHGLYKQLFKKK